MPACEAETHNECASLLSTRACVQLGAGLALSALLIYGVGRFTAVDLMLADLAYDQTTQAFPWREAWLTATFGHRILKAALAVLATMIVAAVAADAIHPWAFLSKGMKRLKLRVIALSAILVPTTTSLLKQASDAHCPWDLIRYGGAEPYVRLFDALPPGVLPGHCLPAGHASSAMWLVSLGVLCLPGPLRRAYRVLGLTLVPGLAMGWMQQLRGAHFLTHTLWSAWIACTIVLALVIMLQKRATALKPSS